jgi:hypothetical protein
MDGTPAIKPAFGSPVHGAPLIQQFDRLLIKCRQRIGLRRQQTDSIRVTLFCA